MKIEKISENQIRCTLTSADLSSRQIRLSELAYGSDKARQLFQDMMQEAEYSVGFSS
ncbi:MAG: adaptor protein MecA, partial [Eubacterium sp.]|nr:adaptor protein MecA [Eubacterium sp.]